MLVLATGPVMSFPVTIRSCDRLVEFDAAPTAAMASDGNMVEMMLVLGLGDHITGMTGVGSIDEIMSEFRPVATSIPLISRNYPSRELIVGHAPDFFFAGWNYGLEPGGEVTPESLGRFGIRVYELTESCIHLGTRPDVTLETMYVDLLNLGRIFGVPGRAEALVSAYRDQVRTLGDRLPDPADWPRVFVYDSGEDNPFTAGRYAMPTALIGVAGGYNITFGLERSWATVNWETVIEHDPEFVIIIDYGTVTAAQKQDFMRSHPALAGIDAVKNNRFVILDYNEATPGPRNIEAVMRLASAFHGIRLEG